MIDLLLNCCHGSSSGSLDILRLCARVVGCRHRAGATRPIKAMWKLLVGCLALLALLYGAKMALLQLAVPAEDLSSLDEEDAGGQERGVPQPGDYVDGRV